MQKERSKIFETAEKVAVPGAAVLGLYYLAIGSLGSAVAAGGIAFALNWHKNSKKS